MKLFSNFFEKSRKIKVQFVDNYDGTTIGISDMLPEQLPETFSIETNMHIHNVDWLVEQAIPENATDFIRSKSLILKMRKIEYLSPDDILFTLPSISNELPEITDSPMFDDYEVLITEDEWRQNEFLNSSSLPLIDIERVQIEDIRENNIQKINDSMIAFTKCHVRDAIGEPNLNVDLKALKVMLNVDKTGSLKLINNSGFVSNGFALKTSNTTFYGIISHGVVKELAISEITDLTIAEIRIIINTFDLIFINWCHNSLITNGN